MILRPFRPPLRPFSSWAYFDPVWEIGALKSIVRQGERNNPKPATIGEGKGVVDDTYRPSKTSWIIPEQIDGVLDVFDTALSQCAQYLGYPDYRGLCEKMQYTVYPASMKGRYDWHQDDCGEGNRVVSMVLALSDPSEYEGGELQVMTQKEPETIDMPIGRIAIFKSTTLHRVTPVTKGTRRSLVAWIA